MNGPAGGSLALRFVDALHPVETVVARFTAVGLDVCRKQDPIHDAWPRASDSGGLAGGALGDITPTSQND